jgi:hypothetical protein
LETPYSNQYNAGGSIALIDGVKGTEDFRTGAWQGYENEDLKATLDLGKVYKIEQASINFLSDQKHWIFLP